MKTKYPTKLPKRFKAKWINALLSGKFKQGRHYLYDTRFGSYCCMGVAGVCAGVSKEKMNNCGYPDDGQDNDKFPPALRGSGDDINDIREFVFNPLLAKLAIFNDDKNKSFKWIAAYIKRYL